MYAVGTDEGPEAQEEQGVEKLPSSNDLTPRVTFDYAAVPAVT